MKDLEVEMNLNVKESAEYKDLEARYMDIENNFTVMRNESEEKRHLFNVESGELMARIRELEAKNETLSREL